MIYYLKGKRYPTRFKCILNWIFSWKLKANIRKSFRSLSMILEYRVNIFRFYLKRCLRMGLFALGVWNVFLVYWECPIKWPTAQHSNVRDMLMARFRKSNLKLLVNQVARLSAISWLAGCQPARAIIASRSIRTRVKSKIMSSTHLFR